MDWRWLGWQVAAPIIGPVALASLFVLLWSTGAKGFTPDYGKVIGNVSPWALTFYSLTLIGSTFHAFLPKFKDHIGLGIFIIIVGGAVCVYASFIAVWSHDSNFVPGIEVYFVTVVLLVASIWLCYKAYARSQEI